MAQSYSVPDGCSPEPVWWRHVSPCFLCCHTQYNPQEEDSVPPRPPLPQSYEPNPPTVPPMPSHPGVRPSSLHKPEDRKANHRNSTHSVSLLTSWLTLPSAVSSHVHDDEFTLISINISCLLHFFFPLFPSLYSIIYFSVIWLKSSLCFYFCFVFLNFVFD